MDFRSDNVTGACPAVIDAVLAANGGTQGSYGADDNTARLTALLSAWFERECLVLPVATGSAANSVALAAVTPPWGAVFCHHDAHINVDECGAPELFTGGAKLVGLDGPGGKVDPGSLRNVLDQGWKGVVHHVQPACLSITQATEWGQVYQADEIAALSAICREHGLALHMDGARFSNALVSGNASAADLTWRTGVDILSLGGTKNGAFAAEAVVCFDLELGGRLGFIRKRGGHLFSKMRFLSAQLEGLFGTDAWRANATNANAMAARLAQGLAALPGCRLAVPVQANEVFIHLPDGVAGALRQAGAQFHPWLAGGVDCYRFVCGWDMGQTVVDQALDISRRAGTVTR